MLKLKLFIVIILFQSCQQQNNKLLGIYKGKVETAEYIYDFKTTKTLDFTVVGDSETIVTNCIYNVSQDKIYIFPAQEQDHVHHLSFLDTLTIENYSCLKQTNLGYKFCK